MSKQLLISKTMSNSFADSLQYLHDEGVSKFQNIEPTIRFIRIFNNLVFNMFSNDHYVQVTKMSFRNFRMKRNYIKHLKVTKDGKKKKKILVTKSRNGNFFRKNKIFHGSNNNPDVVCFQSAYQKLCNNIQISPSLKSSCQHLHTRFSTNANYTNIFKVSSLRPKLFTGIEPDSEFMKNVLKEKKDMYSAIFG